MVEPEMAFFSLEDMMDMEQTSSAPLCSGYWTSTKWNGNLRTRHDFARKSGVPVPRISYDEAVERLNKLHDEATDPEQKQLLHIDWGQ